MTARSTAPTCAPAAGEIISTGPGTPSVGLKLDGQGRLFIAAQSAGARVVDTRTGAILASYALTTATPTFANDVVLTPRAAIFTDSFQPVLYVLPSVGAAPCRTRTASYGSP